METRTAKQDYDAARYAANREAVLARSSAYQLEHRSQATEAGKRFYKKNASNIRAKKKRDYDPAKQRRLNAAVPLAKRLVYGANSRAKKHGIPFDLLPCDVTVPDFCPVLGVRLSRGERKMHWASPTLDRVRPELGYIRGNIEVMSLRANLLKGTASFEEIEKLAAWAKRRVSSK